MYLKLLDTMYTVQLYSYRLNEHNDSTKTNVFSALQSKGILHALRHFTSG